MQGEAGVQVVPPEASPLSESEARSLTDRIRQSATDTFRLLLEAHERKAWQALGYESIPSEANFFMVHIKRQVVPTIEDFRKRGVLVGRPFPPMLEHLRVSVGTADEMNRFMVAFKDIFTPARSTSAQ